jgi:hypothetical protein
MAYRILSLDGGGAWALIEMHCDTLRPELGQPTFPAAAAAWRQSRQL